MRLTHRLPLALALSTLLLVAQGSAHAADTAPIADLPELGPIRAQIYSGEYETAVQELQQLVEATGDNAHPDVYNLLGFSLRNIQRYDEAAHWYRRALYFDATHRATLEYQGELFISLGDIENAQKNHRYLQILCGTEKCPELEQLGKALTKAGHPVQTQ